MTPADAAELLTLCAAFDRRTIGEADARAWAYALRDVPLDDDTRDAVADHYGRTEEWITPAHVRTVRARVRADRIAAAHPVYEPPQDEDETGAQFTARRRAQIAAAADGALPARSIGQALNASPPDNVLALVAGVGRPVGDEPPPYITPERRTQVRASLSGKRAALVELAVDCPNRQCRAGRRHLCKGLRGAELRSGVHASRRDAYATAYATCPECQAGPGRQCTAPEPHPARIRAALAPVPDTDAAEGEQPGAGRARPTTGGSLA
ncbi:zinc finger domain-containing protein [Streptomyces mobaraensis]|uniref:Uncharacterized protein n=1 Tax=Streptomyces mobaraensis TaxID=35621 RepID=A0A5N5W0H6_STRMB|nr:hypothetical protein [Streptomyces mobaraensis]KAB7834049.1 hypothetical protein FRZ00_30775 [Streptomyces mobaraensis]